MIVYLLMMIEIINVPSNKLIEVCQRRDNIGLEALAGWLLLSANFGSSMLRDTSINKASKFWKVGYNKAKAIIKYGKDNGLFRYDYRTDHTPTKRFVRDKHGYMFMDLIAVSLPKKLSTPIKFGVFDTESEAGKYVYITPNDDDKRYEVIRELSYATERQSIKSVVKLLKLTYILLTEKSKCKYDPLQNKQCEKAEAKISKFVETNSKGCIGIYAPLDLNERLTESYIQQFNVGKSLEQLHQELGNSLFSKSTLYRLKKFGMNINVLSRKKAVLCVRDLTGYEPEISIDHKKVEAQKAKLTGVYAMYQDQIEYGEREISKYNKKCEKLDVYSATGKKLYNGTDIKRMRQGKTNGNYDKWYTKLSDIIEPTCMLFGHTPSKREVMEAEMKNYKNSTIVERPETWA